MMQPTYYVRHQDGSYSKADPQPATVVYGSPAPKPPCTVCGVPYEKHGSAPTCASHDYSPGVPSVVEAADTPSSPSAKAGSAS